VPRNFKLTWQAGSSVRGERWRKKYKGKSYYFPGGRGKFDREAYDAAFAAWTTLKSRLDADAPRQFEQVHQLALEQWEQVLAWSSRHGDPTMAAVAHQKIELLRRRLAAPILKPLRRSDQFEAMFDAPSSSISASIWKDFFDRVDPNQQVDHAVIPAKILAPYFDESNGSPRRIEREIWKDRLENQQRRSVAADESVGGHIEQFLAQKEQLIEADEISLGRVYSLRLHLTHFQSWLGRDTSVKEVDGAALVRYHAVLLSKVKSESWSRTTAHDHMATAKSFVRWLWQTEAIPQLPRLLDRGASLLKISRPLAEIVVFTVDEVKTLLKSASERTKLYILLMLNCGMTQKDCSDLLVSEVDWIAGRIIRKRSKTSKEENVPVVNYLLWSSTFDLLKKERSSAVSKRALTNANGSPLWSESTGPSGKYQKTDNVKSAFDRLRKRLKIGKSLKSLKKTSATLLRGNDRFQGLEGLFLGHAPQSMSDRHYTQSPQALLDEAISWLATQYGVK
jgi:integrase